MTSFTVLNPATGGVVREVLLASVDPHKPTVSIALQDAAMDGEAGDVWGRYLSGVFDVPLDFSVTAADVDKDYYQTKVTGLVEDTHSAVNESEIGRAHV